MMEKIIVSDEQYDFMMELVKNPPEPTEALIELMNECSICTSEATVGEVSVQYSYEIDEMIVVKDLYCEVCQNRLKKGLSL